MFLFFIFGTLRMLVRPAMKRLFCLKAKNGLGRFAPSSLPHYNTGIPTQYMQLPLRKLFTELLVDNASVPAGEPFILLLHVGGPFIFQPLVDNASVTAGGPSIFCSTFCQTSQLVFRCRFCHTCRSLSQLTFHCRQRWARILQFFFSMCQTCQTCQPLDDQSQPRCEAAPCDLVMHTGKGNVARATGGTSESSVASIILLLLELRPPALEVQGQHIYLPGIFFTFTRT